MKSTRIPDAHCYACQAFSTGVRDRRPEGGQIEAACARHADPTVPAHHACIYCERPTRNGSVRVDDDHAHASCHREAST